MLTNVKKHKTSHSGKNKYDRGSITLDDCLNAFTKEERMPDVSSHALFSYDVLTLHIISHTDFSKLTIRTICRPIAPNVRNYVCRRKK